MTQSCVVCDFFSVFGIDSINSRFGFEIILDYYTPKAECQARELTEQQDVEI